MIGVGVIYFDSVGVGYIPKEMKKIRYNKNIKTNTCKIQANDSIMCGYFCVTDFIVFMLNGKNFLYNLFFPNAYEKTIE